MFKDYYNEFSCFRALVLDLFDTSLKVLFKKDKKQFSLKTVGMIALKLIDRLEFVHDNGIRYDVKPDNFLLSLDIIYDNRTIYIVDGLVIKFRISKTGHHISYSENNIATGPPRYMSINTYRCISQSRRDGLELLLYIFLMLNRTLQWQSLDVDSDRRNQISSDKRRIISINDFMNRFNNISLYYIFNICFKRMVLFYLVMGPDKKYIYISDW